MGQTFTRKMWPIAIATLLFLSVLGNPAQASPLEDPVAAVSLNVPTSTLVGNTLNFTVTFDNTSAAPGNVGYGPFIDLLLPKNGWDGSTAPGYDGITFTSATYLGSGLTVDTIDCPAGTTITHPLLKTNYVCPAAPVGYAGPAPFVWQLNALTLPFGSFVEDQPAITINISAQESGWADVGQALPIQARGGFMFGKDPLDNPGTDPVIVSGYSTRTTTPSVVILTKTYIGPEDETATGPNFPRQYVITADIAANQTITNLDLTDILPGNLQFVQVDSTTVHSAPASTTSIATPSTTAPGGTLTRRFASVTGNNNNDDASVTFTFFVPQFDIASALVLPADTGDDRTSVDDASLSGTWLPTDPRDLGSTFTLNVTPNDHTLTDKSIAIQKGVANITGAPLSPGDVLEYTLAFQISDFFAFQDLVVTDTFSDGQRWDASFTPILNIIEQSSNSNGAVSGANYSVSLDSPGTGSTTVVFRVSDELVTRLLDAKVLGGCVPATGGAADCAATNLGATTATITFRTIVQDAFSDTYPSRDPSVDQGDVLRNSVTINGTILENTTLQPYAPTSYSESDGSASEIAIPYGTVSKTIYAINGVICPGEACPNQVQVTAGDTITYRVRYVLVTSDFEDLQFTDYLPLPVFNVSEFTSLVFDTTVSSTAPSAGQAKFGPADTFFAYSGLTPTMSISPAGNSLNFFYGDYDNPSNQARVIDILFTVTTRTDPFADKLFLTNQVQSLEGSTNAAGQTAAGIIQITLTEPVITFTGGKGVVWSDAPGVAYVGTRGPAGVTWSGAGCPRYTGTVTSAGLLASPINANVTGIDAGDRVTFAMTVENTGTGLNGAFDVKVKDALPAGFTYVANSLCVTDGTGAAIGITDLDGSVTGSGVVGTGIELIDPGPTAIPTGALDPYNATSGRNVAVVTFDAIVPSNVQPLQVYTNTATLFNFANSEGGPDFTATDLTDTATVTGRAPAASKTLVSTEIVNANNSSTQAVIGELVTYDVTVTLREGLTRDVRIVDTLDNGSGQNYLVFVDMVSVTPSAALSTTLAGGFPALLNDGTTAYPTNNPVISNSGRTISFYLGDITNSNTDNSVSETVVLRYTVMVADVLANQQGSQRNNSAQVSYVNGATGARVNLSSVSAANVTVIEPVPSLTKTVPAGTYQAGDLVTYTIVLRNNTTAANTTDAFDLTFSDVLPQEPAPDTRSLLLAPTFNVVDSVGTVLSTDFELVGSDAAGWILQTKPGFTFDLPKSTTRTITITVSGTLPTFIAPNYTFTNTARAFFTSLDGDYSANRSIYAGTNKPTERNGVLASPLDDYIVSASAPLTTANVAPGKIITGTGFAWTSDPSIAVGETISYQAAISVPQGTAYNFRITDTLDAGLAFVSCDSISSTATIATGLPMDCAHAVIPAGGATLTLDLGNVVNSDTDPATIETIVLNYTVVVLNTASTNRGVSLNNLVTARWEVWPGGTVVTNTGSAPVRTVIEPTLQVAKTVVPSVGDAGDEFTFTVVISHTITSNSPAYDVAWADVVPVSMIYQAGTLTQTGGYAATLLSDAAAPALAATWTDFPLGQTATLTFKVKLAGTVAPDAVLTNTAGIVWTGVPGDLVGPVSPYNDQSCERTGNPLQPCGGGNNDYVTTDPADITVGQSPSIQKALETTNQDETSANNVTIGEEVTYRLTVNLPEGTTTGLVVTDVLPAGLQYVAGSAALDTTGFGGSVTMPSVSGGASNGEDVVFTFSPISVTGDNDITNNHFDITLRALVLDVPGNTGYPSSTNLTNSATLRIGAGTVYNSGTVTTPVVEPHLTLTKTFTPDTAAVNDTTTITLVLGNNGTSTAYDVVVSDPLPKARYSDVTLTGVPVDFACVLLDSPTDTTVQCTGGPVLVSETRTFNFTVNLVAINPAEVVTNTAAAITSTLSGVETGERTEPQVTASDTLTGIIPDLRIVKTDGVSSVVAGDAVTYSLTVTNIGTRKTDGIVITETVPLHATFNDPTATSGWDCTHAAPAGTVCHYTVPGDLDVNGSVVVSFPILVDNPVPAGVNSLINTATVADAGTHGADPTPANNTSTDTDTLNAAPDLTLTKTDGDVSGIPGGTITYTLSYANVGTQDATGVVITETVPAYTTYTGSGWTCSPNANAGSACTTSIGNLAVGASGTVTFTVTVDAALPAGVTSTLNSAVISDDGTNGADPTPGNNTATDNTPLDAQPDLAVTKTDSDVTANPGGTITYTIGYQNKGNQDAKGVFLTETVPTYTTYSGSGWTCLPDISAGSTCTYPVGNLAVGASGTATFTVTVDTTVPAGVEGLSNTVSVDDDHANGTDPTPEDNTATEPTPLDAAPDMTILKTDSVASVTPGSTLVYSLAYSNVGDQDATGVMLTETVPTYTTYSGSNGWVCLPDSNAGSTCTYVVGAVAAGAGGTVDFTLTVDTSIPAGANQIDNTASVADDGTNGADPTPSNNTDDEDTPIDAAPDLTVLKTDGGVSADAGGALTYTITYQNVGSQDADGVVLTETVPAYTTYSGTTWTCLPDNNDGSTCTYNIGDLAVGTSGSVDFELTVDATLPAGVDEVTNTVTIADDGLNGTDPTPGNNTSTDDTPVNAAPNLSVTKDDGGIRTVTGGVIPYTLSYANAGTQDATGVEIAETVPANTTYTGTNGWVCSPDNTAGSTCTYIIGDLAVGASGSVIFEVTVIDAVAAGVEQIDNHVEIADNGDNGDDLDPSDNDDDDSTPMDAVPDLAIVKDDGQTETTPGSIITYTLSYVNNGDQGATGVVIAETIPVNTTFYDPSGTSGWSCSDGALPGTVCTYTLTGELAAGAAGSVSFSLLVDTPLPTGVTEVANTAVIADDGTNGDDPTPTDNESTDTDTITAAPDIAIEKTDGITQTAPGATLTYTLTVSNLGDQDATGVVVEDTIPAGTSFVSADSGGTYDSLSGKVSWTPFDLASGDTRILTVTVIVDNPLDESITHIINTTEAHDDGSNGDDPNEENNSDTDTDLVGSGSKELIWEGQTTDPTARIGEVVMYDISLIIGAQGEAANLVLTDVLDRGLAFVDCTVEGGTLTPDALHLFADICNPVGTSMVVGTEPPASTNPADAGRKFTLTFGTVKNETDIDQELIVHINTVVLNSIENKRDLILTNAAEWTWDGGVVPLVSEPITLIEPDLDIIKTVSPEEVVPGQEVTFTLTIQHTKKSNSDAYDVMFVDKVPTGLTYVPGSFQYVSGQVPTLLDESGAPILAAVWDLFENNGQKTVLRFKAKVGNLSPGKSVTNNASLAWSSMPGDVTTPQSPYNQILSTERYYVPRSNTNIYGANSSATITVPELELPATGFAPGFVTVLPDMPANAYHQTDGMTLVIPSLKVSAGIMGVPLTDGEWDLTWLGTQAGYLEGTSFPTWAGNSAITAHVYNADGTPGPFNQLGTLKWGDVVKVKAFGLTYTYAVRSVAVVQPGDLSVLKHEETSWLTLITCKGYNIAEDSYSQRVVVRAVLVNVGAE